MRARKFILLWLLVLCAVAGVQAQVDGGISISPPRMEIIIPAGTEKTVGMIVDYTRDFPEAKLPIARLVARLEDWSVAPNGELMLRPVGTLPRTAAGWVTYTPPEFTLAADTRQIIRFTFSVPKDTPPGDYYLACYIQGRDAPPPPKEGGRQITVSFRYYTLIYVKVPGLTDDAALLALEAKVVNGYPVVIPQMENKGNSRVRPKHAVEIRNADGKVVFTSPMAETMVVLGGHSWQKPFPINAELPAGKYKLSYTVDFGDKKELQVGNTEFVVTETDIAARQKDTAEKTGVAQGQKPAVAPGKSDGLPAPLADSATTAAGNSLTPASKKPRR